MPPAEIWQGGKKINTVIDNIHHTSKLNGEKVVVSDMSDLDKKRPGCYVGKVYLDIGDSITLDSGELVKSVRRKS